MACLLPLMLLGACSRPAPVAESPLVTAAAPATVAATAATPPTATATLPASTSSAAMPVARGPKVLVHKDPDCGCCELWVEHLRADGFEVEVRDVADLDAVKRTLGIPADKAACHTAEVAGYVVEGHVPAADIRRLVAEKPKARGLVLPGMPLGSPGMGEGSPHAKPYTVELLRQDGSVEAYARH